VDRSPAVRERILENFFRSGPTNYAQNQASRKEPRFRELALARQAVAIKTMAHQ
jgi:hypothetical protein